MPQAVRAVDWYAQAPLLLTAQIQHDAEQGWLTRKTEKTGMGWFQRNLKDSRSAGNSMIKLRVIQF
ncbi:MAG: hypothetical protein AAF732_08070 [Pseudomonadota bacterium]